jgi:hypothetical protein
LTLFDDVDYHEGAAVENGQPPEHGFTHISFFLAWLVRRGLTDPEVIGENFADELRNGTVRPNDLADLVDGGLGSFALKDEGTAFCAFYYEQYLVDYGNAFSDMPDYGVPDEPAMEARAAALIDDAYSKWVAGGRPPASPRPDREHHHPASEVEGVAIIGPGQDDDLVADLEGAGIRITRAEDLERPHAAPELEDLISGCVRVPMSFKQSATARGWGSSLLKAAVRRLDLSANDVVVANGLGEAPNVPTVDIYRLPGIPAAMLEAEFERVIPNRPRKGWDRVSVDGRQVRWALADLDRGNLITLAWFATDGYVVFLSSASPEEVESTARCLGRTLDALETAP